LGGGLGPQKAESISAERADMLSSVFENEKPSGLAIPESFFF